MKYNVAVIPGDGIGPEIVREARKVLDKVGAVYGHEFAYTELLMGGASIDVHGVGTLVSEGVRRARSTKPGIKLGVCGEHGGDPLSIHFFHGVGLDYVSCSPFRVPVARLEAGRAAVEDHVDMTA